MGYPDAYISVRKKILYKTRVELYLVFAWLFFNK